MRVNKYLLPLLGVIPMVAIVFIAQLTGNWTTSGRAAVDMTNMTPEDIKGWMTWQEVSDGFSIPLGQLYALAGVPKDIPASTAMKDMEGLVEGFETTTVRAVVAAYLAGEPSQSTGAGVDPAATALPGPSLPDAVPTATPAPAATEASPAGAIETPGQPAAAQEHLPVGDGSGTGMGEGAGPTPLPPGQILPAGEIKGRHTLAGIAQQAAVPLDKLIAALNLPADVDPNTQVKDLVNSGAVAEVQTVRDAVAELQAAGQ